MGLVLVDPEPGADRGDLAQHTARLEEVHRAKVKPVDHRRRPHTGRRQSLAPGLLLLRVRGERHVVHRARASPPVLLRRRVVDIEAAALLAAHLPARPALPPRETERLAEQPLAVGGLGDVNAHTGETLQRVLARYLTRTRDQRFLLTA